MTNTYELKLTSGKVITWEGEDGEDAVKRYIDCERGTVIAWRSVAHGLFFYNPNDRIIQ